MSEQFISEMMVPVTATMDTSRMAMGEPGLPREFIWRGKTVVVEMVLKAWRTTRPCRHGSGERYVGRHWYDVRVVGGTLMRIYFDRQPENGRAGMGWWVFSVREEEKVRE